MWQRPGQEERAKQGDSEFKMTCFVLYKTSREEAVSVWTAMFLTYLLFFFSLVVFTFSPFKHWTPPWWHLQLCFTTDLSDICNIFIFIALNWTTLWWQRWSPGESLGSSWAQLSLSPMDVPLQRHRTGSGASHLVSFLRWYSPEGTLFLSFICQWCLIG